jgi:hypothetical protein
MRHIAIATEDIDDNSFGYINIGGLVRGIDTSDVPAGSIAFVSEVTAGEMRATPPDAPNFTAAIGMCITSHGSEGILLSRPTIAPRLQSLSDVDARGNQVEGSVLAWDDANSKWVVSDVNATIAWDDMLGPLNSSRIDSASTRYAYNFFNGAISFDDDARYPEEIVEVKQQIPHAWKVGTNAKPHIHWKQQSADIPNFLLGWKLSENGESDIIETNFNNFTFTTLQSHAFTYTSGVLNQISDFPEIDLTAETTYISDVLTIVLFRDTTNASSAFGGSDPSSLVEMVTDLDCHIQIDSFGSEQVLIK